MAITDKTKQAESEADFADQFNGDEPKKNEQSEDEAFGLEPDKPADEAGAAAAAAPAAEAATPAETAPSEAELRIKEREAALDKREAELADRAAALDTSNAGEKQTVTPGDDGKAGQGDGGSQGDVDGEDDPGKLLAEDFGPDFLVQLERFIKKVCNQSVTEGLGGMSDQVQSLIKDLENERHVNHFKAISAAHADFMEVTKSPEFTDWLATHQESEKADLERIVASGSAEEIIGMLTKFKDSKQASGAPVVDDGEDEHHQASLDAAEGVRSSGLTLPAQPKVSQDFAAAWAQA